MSETQHASWARRGPAIWTVVLAVLTVAWGTTTAFDLADGASALRIAYLLLVTLGLAVATVENYRRWKAGTAFAFRRPLRSR